MKKARIPMGYLASEEGDEKNLIPYYRLIYIKPE
jgi:hypothetical protein